MTSMPRKLGYSTEMTGRLWDEYCDCGCTPGDKKKDCFECLRRAIKKARRDGKRKGK